MGKKSRKIRDKQAEWTKHNKEYNEALQSGQVFGLKYQSPSIDCQHGDAGNDPKVKTWRLEDHQRWFQQATNVATFGQMYLSRAKMAKDLTQVSVMWIVQNKELVDEQYVKIAYASPVTELTHPQTRHDPQWELARFKTELGIVAEAFVEMGDSFMLASVMKMHPRIIQMEEDLDAIRQSKQKLAEYLSRQVPPTCHCLDPCLQQLRSLVANSSEEELHESLGYDELLSGDFASSSSSTTTTGCNHHGELSTPTNNEMWVIHTFLPLTKYFEGREYTAPDGSHPNYSNGTYKRFGTLMKVFRENPSFCKTAADAKDFAEMMLGMATGMILDDKDYETAEWVTNLGMIAELYASRGVENVDADIDLMMNNNKDPKMKPYLRDLLVEMKDANRASSIVRVLQKRIPCKCLDNLRAMFHSEGEMRSELCEVCWKVYPKKQFKKCSRCKLEDYCCRDCQRKDWPEHKQNCNRWSSALEAGSTTNEENNDAGSSSKASN